MEVNTKKSFLVCSFYFSIAHITMQQPTNASNLIANEDPSPDNANGTNPFSKNPFQTTLSQFPGQQNPLMGNISSTCGHLITYFLRRLWKPNVFLDVSSLDDCCKYCNSKTTDGVVFFECHTESTDNPCIKQEERTFHANACIELREQSQRKSSTSN